MARRSATCGNRGVLLDGASTLQGGNYLEIDDSQGHGVLLGAQVSTVQCEHVLHAESPPVP